MVQEHLIGPRVTSLKVRVKIQNRWYEFTAVGRSIYSKGDRPWRPDLITADQPLPYLTTPERAALRQTIWSGLQDQVRVKVNKFNYDIIAGL